MWFFLLIFALFFSKTPTLAADEFTQDQQITYNLKDNLLVQVEQKIKLTNLISTIYAKEYSLNIDNQAISNLTAFDETGNILQSSNTTGTATKINLSFSTPALGKNQAKSFTLLYTLSNALTNKGQVWDVVLPQITNPYSGTTSLTVIAPNNFGQVGFSSNPKYKQEQYTTTTRIIYSYTEPTIPKTLLTLGESQIFKFSLNYDLNNPSSQTVTKAIPIPPDTGNQQILIQSLDPKPVNIQTDKDGNWLAQYSLKPEQVIHIKITGLAKLFSNTAFSKIESVVEGQTSANSTWPSTNSTITDISSTLSSSKAIYDYTKNLLSYDYSRINSSGKLGVLNLLNNPTQALCTEYTDLFITLARAKNIPAREVIGFAYSTNNQIRPVNLNADILHAWPQFYNPARQSWQDIDPTWGDTTSGVDYFNSMDLNHLTFIIRGQDPTTPLPPGAYKLDRQTKSVQVDFSTEPFVLTNLPLKFNFNFQDLTHFKAEISNPNPHALYSQQVQDQTVALIPPLSTQTITLKTPSLWPFFKISINNSLYSYVHLPTLILLIFTLLLALLLALFSYIIIHRHEKNS